MILTGKCREDFEKWYWNDWLTDYYRSNNDNFEAISNLWKADEIYLYPLITYYFDSVGIYIQIYIWHREKGIMFFGWDIGSFNENLMSHKRLRAKSRFEAVSEAIKEANEIYNSRK